MSKQAEFIPPSTDDLAAFIQELGPCDEVSVTPLAQGHHNAIYLCQSGPTDLPDPFVLRYPRCPSAARALESDSRTRPILLEGLKTPQVLGFGNLALCGTPVLLEEYIDGQVRDFAALEPKNIRALALVISEVHQRMSDTYSQNSGQPPAASGTYADYIFAMFAESVTDRLRHYDMQDFPDAAKLIRHGQQALQRIVTKNSTAFSGGIFSLLHHDLNQANVLWTAENDALLIDWNPTYGDPADDLDYLCTDNPTSAFFKAELVDAYVAAGASPAIIDRIDAYTLKNRLDDLAWTIQMQHQCGASYQQAYQQRVVALDTLLETFVQT